MRNVLMLVLSFFLLSNIQTTRKDAFFEEVKKGYSSYEIVENEENEDYILGVVRGINKNRASLGIYFYSICEDEYYLTVADNTNEYKFKTNDAKEINNPAITFSSNLTIKVYNCDDELIHSLTVQMVRAATFTGTQGEGKGISFSSPNQVGGLSKSLIVFYIIGIGIIALSAIIIILLKINKRGMFDDEKRKEGIDDFKAFEHQYVNEQIHNEEDNVYDIPSDDYNVEETEQVYERSRDYDDEDIVRDVKGILKQRGLNTLYEGMSVEEKNKVMVELMMMREQSIITNEEYQHEIIDLWKK